MRGSRGGRGTVCPDPAPPWKISKLSGILAILVRILRVNQARIQCWAIVGPPVKRHLYSVLASGPTMTHFSGILILSLSHNHLKKGLRVELNHSDKTSGSVHVACSELGNKTTISYLSVHHRCLRPRATVHPAGQPQHLG